MQQNCPIEKKNSLKSLKLVIFIFFFCYRSTFCHTNQSNNAKANNSYKHLDIENKENIFKIDLTAHPSKKSNSFLELVNHKKSQLSNFSLHGGVKQYIHFHSSVRKITLK